MQKLLSASIIAIAFALPAFADDEPTVIPANEPGCNENVLNTTEGSAALEAIYTPNTIGTTWYNDGVQVTGDNVPSSCAYDSEINLPPTPTKTGYDFIGWRVYVPPCLIPSADVSTDGNAYAAKRLDGEAEHTYGGATAATYGISDPGEWGVSWGNGDKAIGEALCSQTGGTAQGDLGTPDTSGAGTRKYCWCRATGYMPNGGEQCSFVSASWVLYSENRITDSYCTRNCSNYCINAVRTRADFRAAMFTGLVAQ